MNREERLAKKRAYYAAHKDQWAKYRREHQEELRIKAKERRHKRAEAYKETRRRWRANNKDKANEYNKKYQDSEKGKKKRQEYYEEHKEEFFRRARESRSRNHDESRCHSIVSNSIARGIIKRQPCEVCGEAKAYAHHCDYNKPLDVMWLCSRHHAEWHKKNKPIRANNVRVCAHCGKKFTFTHGSQKYCSAECRTKHRAETTWAAQLEGENNEQNRSV